MSESYFVHISGYKASVHESQRFVRGGGALLNGPTLEQLYIGVGRLSKSLQNASAVKQHTRVVCWWSHLCSVQCTFYTYKPLSVILDIAPLAESGSCRTVDVQVSDPYYRRRSKDDH